MQCGKGADENEKAAEKPKLPFSGKDLKKKTKKLKDVKTDDTAVDSHLNAALIAKEVAANAGGAKLKPVPDDQKKHKDAPKTKESDYVKKDESKEAEKK